jgi:hypothetical protein
MENLAADENWREIDRKAWETALKWREISPWWHILIDHSKIYRVEEPLRLLSAQIKNRDKKGAVESLAAISYWLEQVRETEKLSLRNIF